MATANLDLQFAVKGLSDLQKLERRITALEKNTEALTRDLGKATKKVEELGKKARRSAGGVGALAKQVVALVTAAAVLGTTRFVIGKTAELETQTRSLQVLTGELSVAKGIIQELQGFASVTPFTSTELIESAKRLKAFGVDTEKLVDTTKRLADISGATGARLSEVATAYGQVQAKGRLQGEELLQLQERGIDIQGELQRMYGLSGEEFSKALQKGRISAKATEVAIERLTNKGGKYANGAISQSDTLAGRFSTLQDNIDTLARNIGETLKPAIDTVLRLAIKAVNEINTLLSKGAEANKFGLKQKQLDAIDRKAFEQAKQISDLRGYGAFDPRRALLQSEIATDLLRGYGYESGQLQIEIEPVVAAESKIPELLKGNSGDGSSGGSGSTPRNDIDRATELLRKQEQRFALMRAEEGLARDLLSITQQRSDEFEQINALQGVSTDLLETLKANASLLADNKQLEAIEKFGENALKNAKAFVDQQNLQIAADDRRIELQEQGMSPALASQIVQIEQQFDLKEDLLELDIQQLKTALLVVDAEGAKAEKIREQIKLLEQYKQKLGQTEVRAIENARRNDETEPGKLRQYMDELSEELADTEGMIVSLAQTIESEIGSAMATAISGVIDGTKTAQESFSQMFKNIGDAFIKMASDMIAKALVLKALNILLPGSSPASPIPLNIGGAEAIGRASFSGGGYTGDGPRVGGLDGQGGFPAILHPQETVIDHRGSSMDHRGAMQRYGSGGGSVQVNYTGPTMTFNEVDYVPKSAVPDIIRAAAKEGAAGGHARSMTTLKNSRSQRSKLGMR